ncbi:MAG: Bax inhibitor-1/YccA family protein [Gammaproteobacteria bacterium]|nr:MAG: Bax inhibitor-1/YccA family protein [Gammaproteobacteria bacterium]
MQPVRRIDRGQNGSTALYQDAIRESSLATNKVLKNTYMLLSATLIFSAVMASVAMATNMPPLGMLVTLGGYFGLLFLTYKFKNSSIGLICVFALTGFMGLTLGPLLSAYIETVPNGGQLVLTALGTTGLIFLSLSAYVLTTRKDMSFMGGFLMIGMIGLLGVIVIGLFVDLSAFQMAISAGVVLLMSGMILYQTSAIIHGGETNYVLATVSLYVSLYNIFIHLLMLFGMGGDD